MPSKKRNAANITSYKATEDNLDSEIQTWDTTRKQQNKAQQIAKYFAEQAKKYAAITAQQPNNAKAHYQLGIAFAHQNLIDAASNCLTTAWSLGLNPPVYSSDISILQQLHLALIQSIQNLNRFIAPYESNPRFTQQKEEIRVLIQEQIIKTEKLALALGLKTSSIFALTQTFFTPLSTTVSISSSSTQIVGSPTTPITPTTNNIINVSGFGNNCGLYALTLGIKKYLTANPTDRAVLNHIKNLLDKIDESSLTQRNASTAEIGKQLRGYLFIALRNNPEFKQKRRENFVAYIVNYLNKKELPADMATFKSANQTLLNSLYIKWKTLEPVFTKISFPQEFLKKHCDTITCTDSEITTLKNQIASNNFEINLLLNNIWQASPEQSTIDKTIKFRKLFDHEVYGTLSGETVGYIKECLRHFIDKQIATDLQIRIKDSVESYVQMLQNYALLTFYNFQTHELKFIETEVITTMCRYWVDQNLSLQHSFDEVYAHYCDRLLHHPEMLSADELDCLAAYFGVGLSIEFSDGSRFEPRQQANLPQITLCNPSQDHWQVVCPPTATLNLMTLATVAAEPKLIDPNDISTEPPSEEDDNEHYSSLQLSH